MTLIAAPRGANRTDRPADCVLDELVMGGETDQIRANAVDTIKSDGIKGDVGRIAAGAGAVIGGIIGGVKVGPNVAGQAHLACPRKSPVN